MNSVSPITFPLLRGQETDPGLSQGQCVTQTASFLIWIRIADSITFEDNRYVKHTFLDEKYGAPIQN